MNQVNMTWAPTDVRTDAGSDVPKQGGDCYLLIDLATYREIVTLDEQVGHHRAAGEKERERERERGGREKRRREREGGR